MYKYKPVTRYILPDSALDSRLPENHCFCPFIDQVAKNTKVTYHLVFSVRGRGKVIPGTCPGVPPCVPLALSVSTKVCAHLGLVPGLRGCRGGRPAIVSKPHFLGASPALARVSIIFLLFRLLLTLLLLLLLLLPVVSTHS